MKSCVLLLIAFCCVSASYSQASYDADIELLSKELSQQAIARGTLRVAVLDFTEGETVTDFSLSLSEELRIHMAVRNSELTIVDRAATERVMEEQRLTASPLFDENKAATVGKLVSADAIITGKLMSQTGRWRVTSKLISVETGAVVGGYATWLDTKTTSSNEVLMDYELPSDGRPEKRLSFHTEATAGLQMVNQAPATGVGFVFSRLKYRGDAKASRFEKGKKGFLVGLHYFAGLPKKSSHDYILGYRMVDSWGTSVQFNETDVYQDSYFLVADNASVIVTELNSLQPTVPVQLYKAKSLRVDRLRIDLAWRYSMPVPLANVYAEFGLAYSRQFDRSTYGSLRENLHNDDLLNLELANEISAPPLPTILELKAAVGAERGRWGIHLEGAITTRNRNYMSPLDMFHHPEMLNWSSMQADLADDGVGEITQKSASEQWYYWLSSIIQLRYQL
jgi:TolB-like protein